MSTYRVTLTLKINWISESEEFVRRHVVTKQVRSEIPDLRAFGSHLLHQRILDIDSLDMCLYTTSHL